MLLGCFGEEAAPCGKCDICLDPPQTWDGTQAARKFMSAALRTGQRFGAAHLIDLLLGRETDKMRQHGHERLPTFGVGADLDEPAWRSVARQLVAAGLLHADAQRHGALVLTEAARPVHFSLFGRQDEQGAWRERWFGEEAELAQRESDNLLYVALTRAEQGWADDCIVTTVGWAVRDTPKVLSLAAEDMGDGTWRGVTHIPRVCILSIVNLSNV